MELYSSAFENNQFLPSRFVGTGDDISPPLEWTDVPADCRSLALLCEDPDAPITSGKDHPITHWIVYNVPPTVTTLHENIEKKKTVEDVKGMAQGKNSLGKIGYSGPKPPKGDAAHRYIFTLFALDVDRLEEPGLEKADINSLIEGHVIDSAQIIGKYQIPPVEPADQKTIPAIGFAATSAHGRLNPFAFTRKEPKENEVQIEILYCGVCHSEEPVYS